MFQSIYAIIKGADAGQNNAFLPLNPLRRFKNSHIGAYIIKRLLNASQVSCSIVYERNHRIKIWLNIADESSLD